MSIGRILFEIQGFAMLSGLLFYYLKANPIAILPLLLYICFRSIPLIRIVDYRWIVIILAGFALLIDDVSQVAWGREIETVTELMGKALFESFGINGLELFSVMIIGWILLIEQDTVKRLWLKHGILIFVLLASSYFLASFVSGIVGLMKGGNLNTHFIQSRFLHLLPMWSLIGFMVIDRSMIASRLLNVIVFMVILKSFQALFVYFFYPSNLIDEEYLVDHYFSMFSVIVLAFVGTLVFLRKGSIFLRISLLLSLIPVTIAYILNDRRTSFVALAFAILLLLAFLPLSWYRQRQRAILILILLAPAAFAVSWYLPKPLSFVRDTIESLQSETDGTMPSYRQLENANLLNEIGSSPILGIGTGQEFREAFLMPDISFVYDRYRMVPHNLFLSSWAYGGLLGITTLSLIFVQMISVSGSLFRATRDSSTICFAVCSLFFLVQFIVYTYADLGLQIPRNQMFAGLFFGGAMRLLAFKWTGDSDKGHGL